MKTLFTLAALALPLSAIPASALVFEVSPSYSDGEGVSNLDSYGASMGLWTQWGPALDLGIRAGYYGSGSSQSAYDEPPMVGTFQTEKSEFAQFTAQARFALPTPIVSTFLTSGMGVYWSARESSSETPYEDKVGSAYFHHESEDISPGLNFGAGVDLPSFHPSIRISAEGTYHYLMGGEAHTTASMVLGVVR